MKKPTVPVTTKKKAVAKKPSPKNAAASRAVLLSNRAKAAWVTRRAAIAA